MQTPVSNCQRIQMALAGRRLPDLPFLPWGLDALAEPPHPSYAPLFRVLRERAVIKRRWTVRPDFFLPGPSVERDLRRSARSDGATIESVRLSGPGGHLSSQRQSIPGTSAGESTSRFLKSADDVRLHLSWPYVDEPADAAPFSVLRDETGDSGVVTCRLPTALGVVGENFKPEPFALCSLEDLDAILSLMSVIASRITRFVTGLLEGGARPIFILGGPEFATPPLLSPRHFDEYVVRFDQPLIELIHSYGCPVIVHCHGRLDAVLERFAEMGADGLHPLEAPPMGDVTLVEASRRVGKSICFLGNLQIGDMMSVGADEIRRQVWAIREQIDTPMILTTSATPYELVMTQRLYDNYVAAIEAASA